MENFFRQFVIEFNKYLKPMSNANEISINNPEKRKVSLNTNSH